MSLLTHCKEGNEEKELVYVQSPFRRHDLKWRCRGSERGQELLGPSSHGSWSGITPCVEAGVGYPKQLSWGQLARLGRRQRSWQQFAGCDGGAFLLPMKCAHQRVVPGHQLDGRRVKRTWREMKGGRLTPFGPRTGWVDRGFPGPKKAPGRLHVSKS